jgi:hypothetical protein
LNALSFHSLRRTATTLLHEAGIAGAVAQALIGHDSEAIHERYVNVGRDALQKAGLGVPNDLNSSSRAGSSLRNSRMERRFFRRGKLPVKRHRVAAPLTMLRR